MKNNNKITLDHLSRLAVVYIRQSTARQVQFNEESTRRQYALKDMLIEYGWAPEMIEVIDEDLGTSGKYSENRFGFQKLVGEVANGRVGAIACIEASRLSRNSSDWGRIIEYCAMTFTLIVDEETVYNPLDPNDRLLLGVKGSLTEMELHNIRLRMQGGLLNKVKRGELCIRLPVGYVYDPLSKVIFDPSKDVQDAIHKLFHTFEIEGSVNKTVANFDQHGLLFPFVHHSGPCKGECSWQKLTRERALFILKHPFYTGCYVYGRSQTITTPLNKTVKQRDKENWIVNIPDHHPAYISEETYQRNLAKLEENANSHKGDFAPIPGHGNGLLQGIVYCGHCGARMHTIYQKSLSKKRNWMFPVYICKDKHGTQTSYCMQVNGTSIDEKVSELVQQRLTPEAIKDAIEVKKELEQRSNETIKILEQRVQKADYEASQMRRRYMACDPDNALVRIDIERAYNEKLAACADAQKALDDEQSRHTIETDSVIEKRLETLITDFNAIWDSPKTDNLVKKRLIRTIIQSVTLTREKSGKDCKVQILYTGGETDEFIVNCRQYGANSISWKVRDILTEKGIDYLPSELASMLNEKGLLRSNNTEWTGTSISAYMSNTNIMTRRRFYREKGYLTPKEFADKIGIKPQSLYQRIAAGKYQDTYVKVTDHYIMFNPNVEKESTETIMVNL